VHLVGFYYKNVSVMFKFNSIISLVLHLSSCYQEYSLLHAFHGVREHVSPWAGL